VPPKELWIEIVPPTVDVVLGLAHRTRLGRPTFEGNVAAGRERDDRGAIEDQVVRALVVDRDARAAVSGQRSRAERVLRVDDHVAGCGEDVAEMNCADGARLEVLDEDRVVRDVATGRAVGRSCVG